MVLHELEDHAGGHSRALLVLLLRAAVLVETANTVGSNNSSPSDSDGGNPEDSGLEIHEESLHASVGKPLAWTPWSFVESIADVSVASDGRVALAGRPFPRYAAASTVLHGKMYIFGGRSNPSSVVLSDLWEFDLNLLSWKVLTKHRPFRQWIENDEVPAGRYGHSLVAYESSVGDNEQLGDSLLLLGGYSTNCTTVCDEVWEFFLGNQTWHQLYGIYYTERGLLTSARNVAGRVDPPADANADDFFLTPQGFRWQKSVAVEDVHTVLAEDHRHRKEILFIGGKNGYDGISSTQWRFQVARRRNLALERPCRASSVSPGGGACGLAVDGNADGIFENGSVFHSDYGEESYIEVDLGFLNEISIVRIHRSTSLCPSCVSSTGATTDQSIPAHYIFVSATPFSSRYASDLQNESGVRLFVLPRQYQVSRDTRIDETARYVRVQLGETGYLALAELEVLGYERSDRFSRTPSSVGPLSRIHSAVTRHERHIYAFGGLSDAMPHYLQDFWRYDVIERQWAPVSHAENAERRERGIRYSRGSTSAPIGRSGHVLFSMDAIDGADSTVPSAVIGVHGGFSAHYEGNERKELLDDTWIFRTDKSVWIPLSFSGLRPAPRMQHEGVAHNGKLYIFGGASDKCAPETYRGAACGDLWALDLRECPDGCSSQGTCAFTRCECVQGYRGDSCALPLCPGTSCTFYDSARWQSCVECSGNGVCLETGVCDCEGGYVDDACSVLRCPNNCSGNGLCTEGGICECFPGFIGDDCGESPCKNACMYPNGECDTEVGLCSCLDGFALDDCSMEIFLDSGAHGNAVPRVSLAAALAGLAAYLGRQWVHG